MRVLVDQALASDTDFDLECFHKTNNSKSYMDALEGFQRELALVSHLPENPYPATTGCLKALGVEHMQPVRARLVTALLDVWPLQVVDGVTVPDRLAGMMEMWRCRTRTVDFMTGVQVSTTHEERLALRSDLFALLYAHNVFCRHVADAHVGGLLADAGISVSMNMPPALYDIWNLTGDVTAAFAIVAQMDEHRDFWGFIQPFPEEGEPRDVELWRAKGRCARLSQQYHKPYGIACIGAEHLIHPDGKDRLLLMPEFLLNRLSRPWQRV